MSSNRDNAVDLTRERLKRDRAMPIVGRLFQRFGNLRIGHANRRVEVRQFRTDASSSRPGKPAA